MTATHASFDRLGAWDICAIGHKINTAGTRAVNTH